MPPFLVLYQVDNTLESERSKTSALLRAKLNWRVRLDPRSRGFLHPTSPTAPSYRSLQGDLSPGSPPEGGKHVQPEAGQAAKDSQRGLRPYTGTTLPTVSSVSSHLPPQRSKYRSGEKQRVSLLFPSGSERKKYLLPVENSRSR